MPLFKKSSHGKNKDDDYQKRLQHQLFVAESNPEPIIDLSECNLKEVPCTAYSMSSVLLKEVLLLHDNKITSILVKGQGTSEDLISLRVLDLHNNKIKLIPDSLCDLINLQVINLENNLLSCLPGDIGRLKHLQTLNVKTNHLSTLPESLSTLASLRTLDISDNNITKIPKMLCHIRTLEILIADWLKLSYPSNEITKDGSTEKVMKALCKDCHLEYLPPSNFVLDVLPSQHSSSLSGQSDALGLQQQIENSYVRLVTDGTDMQEHGLSQKDAIDRLKWRRLSKGDDSCLLQRELVDMEEYEREMHEQEEVQARLVQEETLAQQRVFEQMTKEHIQEQNDLDKYAKEVASDKDSMIAAITASEKKASKLISRLMSQQDDSEKMEELLEAIEKERQMTENFFTVKHEESENLRKQEILKAMEDFLRENSNFEALCRQQDISRKQCIDNALRLERESDAVSCDLLAAAEIDRAHLWSMISEEEQLQKAAFEELMLREDTRYSRLMKEIQLVERQLAELSRVEIERKEVKAEENMKVLATRRDELAQMLSMLMGQRDSRARELQKLMLEMDRHREDTQTDYWLVQYQRILDRKPEQLIKQEGNLDVVIIKILEGADAAEYIPLFARHRFTLDGVLDLSEKDLKDMGVHEFGIRKNIMKMIEKYTPQITQLPSASAGPTAPPEDEESTDIIARGANTECCICMENISSVIFLNCGHVCCCAKCSSTVHECPLCRASIIRRVQLSYM